MYKAKQKTREYHVVRTVFQETENETKSQIIQSHRPIHTSTTLVTANEIICIKNDTAINGDFHQSSAP